MLRLVRDDETTELEELEPSKDGEDTPQDREPAEPADGAVDSDADAEASEQSGSDDASQPQVDSGLLEALLLSTHHPLTAGRIGEVMGLSTTKPVRQAIKELNRQYEETARSFRIEQ